MSGGRPCLLPACVALALLGFAPPARAQSARVEILTCSEPGLDPHALEALLRIELEESQAASISRVRVALDCEAPADAPRARVRVEWQDQSAPTERVIELAGIPLRSVARTIALGAAELFRSEPEPVEPAPVATHAELAPAPVTGPILASPVARGAAVLGSPVQAPSAPREDGSPFALSLEGRLLVLPATGHALGGARAMVDVPLLGPLALRLGAAGAGARVDHALGEIEVGALTALAGLVAGARIDWLGVAIAASLEGGYGWASGRSTRALVVGSQGGAGIALATLEAELSAHLDPHVALRLGGGIAGVLAGMRALVDDATAVALTELLGTLTLGVTVLVP